MTDRPSLSSMISSLLYRSHPFVMVNLLAGILLFIVRGYELWQVAGTVPEGTSLLVTALQIIRVDVLTYGTVFFLLTLLFLLLSTLFHDRIALRVHTILLALLGAASIGLSQYFTMTLVPLGADLFGYSLDDIAETVTASGGLDLLALAGIVSIVALMLFLPSIARRLPSPRPVVLTFYLVCTLSVPLRPLLLPSPDSFSSESLYAVVQNKPAAFALSAGGYLWRSLSGGTGYSSDEYPFLRGSVYDDVLGPFLSPTVTRPNVVIIMVEGLGSAFVEGGNIPASLHSWIHWPEGICSGRTCSARAVGRSVSSRRLPVLFRSGIRDSWNWGSRCPIIIRSSRFSKRTGTARRTITAGR